ncbi:hypothetical protein [Paremcibacter congregatus]|uniref:Uncharacterized protein n=1 Tax=Paremcibacter congregatus TaxID=2043170 RepID=A0A2G4YVN4_9PROT|nr:hypothetical protein [Paremcibacter congregatus]PHZ86391.1 hypothetical protein CRD36_00430 [Paremcibacter congregatus]QDE28512.1 hypothetical protein FIV45_15150 [Paremcibacter congregatus]
MVRAAETAANNPTAQKIAAGAVAFGLAAPVAMQVGGAALTNPATATEIVTAVGEAAMGDAAGTGLGFTVATVGAKSAAGISMESALTMAGDFLDEGVETVSIAGKTGLQFIQKTINQAGEAITKRVGFDLNPASAHVQKLGPHLNLQTQVNGKIINTGELADPHIPIDPATIRKGDY